MRLFWYWLLLSISWIAWGIFFFGTPATDLRVTCFLVGFVVPVLVILEASLADDEDGDIWLALILSVFTLALALLILHWAGSINLPLGFVIGCVGLFVLTTIATIVGVGQSIASDRKRVLDNRRR